MATLGVHPDVADLGRDGVRRTDATCEWYRAGAPDDVAPQRRGDVRVRGVDLVVIRTPRGKVFVFEDSCPHGRARRSAGVHGVLYVGIATSAAHECRD